MTRAEYQTYLASRDWALLRERVRERAGGRCERCWTGAHEQTHHRTYERIGAERLEDLLAVCEACHLFLSGKSEQDPAVAASQSRDPGRQIDDGLVLCFCGDQRLQPDGPLEPVQARDLEVGGFYVKCQRGHRLYIAIIFGIRFTALSINPAPAKKQQHQGGQ